MCFKLKLPFLGHKRNYDPLGWSYFSYTNSILKIVLHANNKILYKSMT